jgi:hypothetical protein
MTGTDHRMDKLREQVAEAILLIMGIPILFVMVKWMFWQLNHMGVR